MNWRDLAVCAQVDGDLFFPWAGKAGETQPYDEQVAQAKAICRGCPSIDPCLREAVSKGYQHGVWGGTSEELRRWLRKPRPGQTVKPPPPPAASTAACGTERAYTAHRRRGEQPCDPCRFAANDATARRAQARRAEAS